MPAISEEIPLLPLPAVLFPGTFIPVQVSEETHRRLLRDCAGRDAHVGVILTPGESEGSRSALPCTTGCLASIALLAHNEDDEFDDAPINAVLYGERRIRVLDFVQQDPYLTGRVQLLEDFGGLHAEKHTAQATQLFKHYLTLISQYYQTDVEGFSLPPDPTMASYLLASVLYLPLATKQRLLEADCTDQRLQDEVAYLRAECEKHEIFHALAQQRQCRFVMPDPAIYLSLISDN